jgi:hypothetical protein
MVDQSPTRLAWTVLLFLLLLGCSSGRSGDPEGTPTLSADGTVRPWEVTSEVTAAPDVPQVALSMSDEDVAISPLPLRAGFPFTITALIHNSAKVVAADVPLLLHMSAAQEEIGFTSFVQLLTVTVPASNSVPITVPVNWNFPGGEHRLWVQINRLPEAWEELSPTQAEANTSDNIVLLDLMVDPFDAYASDLCPGRVDVRVEPIDVLPEPGRQRVQVTIHNSGNRAVYNLPVVVTSDQASGLVYTPAIPPCGGTTTVYVPLSQPIQQGESLTVLVNPSDWPGSLPEDNFDNNRVAVAAGLSPGLGPSPDSELADYDFGISTAGIESPELWIVMVTVHNLGTRDAANVPIRVENENGRKVLDVVPLVQGKGLGVVAIRVGYLWTHGGTLTFTINPKDAEGAYPESNQNNNVATFTLP